MLEGFYHSTVCMFAFLIACIDIFSREIQVLFKKWYIRDTRIV